MQLDKRFEMTHDDTVNNLMDENRFNKDCSLSTVKSQMTAEPATAEYLDYESAIVHVAKLYRRELIQRSSCHAIYHYFKYRR